MRLANRGPFVLIPLILPLRDTDGPIYGTDLQRIYNGLGTDLKRRCNGGKTEPVSVCVFGNRYYVTIALVEFLILFMRRWDISVSHEKKGNIVSVTK